MSFEHKISQ